MKCCQLLSILLIYPESPEDQSPDRFLLTKDNSRFSNLPLLPAWNGDRDDIPDRVSFLLKSRFNSFRNLATLAIHLSVKTTDRSPVLVVRFPFLPQKAGRPKLSGYCHQAACSSKRLAFHLRQHSPNRITSGLFFPLRRFSS